MTAKDARTGATKYLLAKFSLWWERLLNIRKLPTESLQLGISLVLLFIGAGLLFGSHGAVLDPYIRIMSRSWPHLQPVAIGWLLVMLASGSFAAYLDANGDMAMLMMLFTAAVWGWYGGILWVAFPEHIAPKFFVCTALLAAGVSSALALLDGQDRYAAAPEEIITTPKQVPVIHARIIFKQ